MIAEALASLEWELERAPVGKRVEAIEVYLLPVFDKRDPVPNFLNALHMSTRKSVVKQEVLLRVGEEWEVGRVLETERNLRHIRQLSVANVVAAKGSSPDTVRLLVVSKDVWSLRINNDIAIGDSGVDYLLINPAEENFLGLRINFGLLYILERDRHSFGARFIYPRIAGTRHFLAAETTFSTNRDSGEVEGSSGAMFYRMPLYSRHSQWGWGTEGAWRFEVTRRYDGQDIRDYEFEHTDGSVETIPEAFDTERLAADYFGIRSFGVEWKYNLRFGLELDHRRYTGIALDQYSDEAVAAYERDVLPLSDRRVSPYVELRSFQTRFHRVLNLELLGIQEDWRLGHDAITRVYAGAQPLASTRDLLGTLAAVGYTIPLGDGLIRAVAQSNVVLANDGKNEGYIGAQARVASPRVMFGRWHFDAFAERRYLNYRNTLTSLGGNNRLRGYNFDEFLGPDRVALNLEYRSESVDVLSAQVGFAAFVDAGDAPQHLAQTDFKVGTGFGLRILFPQATREVLRLDWAFPLHKAEAWPGAFFVTFGQAFKMPSLKTPTVTPGLTLFGG